MPLQADCEDAGTLPGKVLLVEDNAIVALNAEELLLEIGVKEVMLATSVAEANACCDAQAFGFALLDINLGSETSIEIAIRLHRAKVPFAFTSGLATSSICPTSFQGVRMLTKPYLLKRP